MTSELIPVSKRTLTRAQYGELDGVPPEIERLANITTKITARTLSTGISIRAQSIATSSSNTVAPPASTLRSPFRNRGCAGSMPK
jgi:hypothetical protein